MKLDPHSSRPDASDGHSPQSRLLTQVILETFRLNGGLLSAGDALVGDLGLPAARASVLLALERDPETGDRVKGVIEALRRGDALADGLPDRDWLAGLADWFRAKGED